MKLLRKITALLLTAAMIAVSAVSASAVNIKYYNKDFNIDEIFAGATAAESGKTYQSYIKNRYDSVFYSFSTGKKNTVTIDAEVGLSDWYFNLFDAAGEIVFSKKVNIKSGTGGVGDIGNLGFTWNKSKKLSKVTITYNLKKGKYLAMITSDQKESYTGKIRFIANYSAASSSSASKVNIKNYYTDYTIDELFALSVKCQSGTTYTGNYLKNKYDSYWFSFDCSEEATVTLDVEAALHKWNLDLYDKNGNVIVAKKIRIKTGSGKFDENGNIAIEWNSKKQNSKIIAEYKLAKGKYIVRLCCMESEKAKKKITFIANFSAASSSSSTLGLISESRDAIQKNANIYTYLGQDLYYFTDNDGNSNIYRIDDDVLDTWRETGKFKAQKITVDKKISQYKGWSCGSFDFRNSNYGSLTCRKNGKTAYFAVKYNASSNKITAYYEDNYQFGISPNGYISIWQSNKTKNKAKLDIYNNNGRLTKTLYFDYDADYNLLREFNGTPYCVYGKNKYNSKTGEWSGLVYLIDEKGNKKKISNTALRTAQLYTNFFASTYIAAGEPTEVYLFDKKKTYTIFGKDIIGFRYNGYDYGLIGFASKFYGTKAVGIYRRTLSDGGHEDVYILVDIEKGNYLSKLYYNMVTNDGKIFRVRNENNQYGYIDANGKELGMFDDAAVFGKNGKYAPVCENGKVHFVDRNMKQVSKDYDLGKFPLLTTYGDNVFFWTDLKNYNFMTFA